MRRLDRGSTDEQQYDENLRELQRQLPGFLRRLDLGVRRFNPE